MINCKDISLRRGAKILINKSTFTINRNSKLGITGANGAGKSSLFAMIRGELLLDEGEFSMPPNLTIAHVAQETPPLDIAALEYVIDGDVELRKTQRQIEKISQQEDGMRLAELHSKYEAIEGYTAVARAASLMAGLGFKSDSQNNMVSSFSGGWRMRLNLAQALMCRSDILMLDEPTNHLDLDAVIWLQEWLMSYSGTLMLISHDRDFLDHVTNQILHIEQQKAEVFTGNYSDFERMRGERLAQQQAIYVKQQKEIAHIQSFVERFKAKATKAKQAQSRLKALERMKIVAQAQVDSPFGFAFPEIGRMPNPLIKIEGAELGYGEKTIIKNSSITIAPGDRIALLGSNGAGKSTVVKALAGELPLRFGTRLAAENLNIGYFAQHQLEQLTMEKSPLWHLQQKDKQSTEKELRNFLGGFDFNGDKALETIKDFSGGEKARLVLAMLVRKNPSILLLDEPTNHLDLEMRHALTIALQSYQGAIVVVSHDRHFLRTVCEGFWLIADGKLQSFDGDLDDYRAWTKAQKNVESKETVERALNGAVVSRKDQRKTDAEQRQRIKPYVDAVQKAEQRVEEYHKEHIELERKLADPVIYQEEHKGLLKELIGRKAKLDQDLADAEQEWLEAEEKLAVVQST